MGYMVAQCAVCRQSLLELGRALRDLCLCEACWEQGWRLWYCHACPVGSDSAQVSRYGPGPLPRYCEECRWEVEREQARERMVRMRARRRVTADRAERA